uniref:YitH acetyltransferase (GNAT) domain-containing protein n=1 Tax=Meloidogyne incognita TaxID=6306 RepID=A0A914M028_MELIC
MFLLNSKNNLIISNTKLNKSVGGALFNENNNNSFIKLENVYSTTILDKEKDNLIGFGLAYLQSPNQLYCSLISIPKELENGFYNLKEKNNKEKQEDKQHNYLKIINFKQILPDLSTLPQYFTAFAEPLARPLLQCIVEELAKQCFGNTFNMELTKNMSVDIYDSNSGMEEYSTKLWRDSAGFIVTDRFRYFEIKIKKENLINLFKNNSSLLSSTISILPLNSQTKTLFSIYDQNISSFGRDDYLEFLFKLNGVTGFVAINNEDNQPLGYLIGLNEGGRILQCYAENGEIASLLLNSFILSNNDTTTTIYSMFIRICSSEKENKLNEKLMEKAENVIRVCRYHSRIFPTNIQWSKIFILNIGANLF